MQNQNKDNKNRKIIFLGRQNDNSMNDAPLPQIPEKARLYRGKSKYRPI